MKKEDLRVIKTKKIIYEALIELMKEKPFEEIKVSNICSKALINRTTFYSHYEDKYELLVEFISKLKNEFTKELNKNKNIINPKEYYIELVKLFMNHIEKNKEIYTAIIIKNKNSIMMDILSNSANNEVTKRMEACNINVPSNIITKFYLGGITNIIIEWIKDPIKNKKEDIIKYLDTLIQTI